jgi:hypothetical protein
MIPPATATDSTKTATISRTSDHRRRTGAPAASSAMLDTLTAGAERGLQPNRVILDAT